MVTWDPEQYLRFAAERARPFDDLLARVGISEPAEIADLGCGPGALTVRLARRWPAAHVVGVDSSPEMVERAREHAAAGRLDVVLADLREWQPQRPVDLLVSNATLQWVPDHLSLLRGWTEQLAVGGWLALQVLANFGDPSHTLLAEVAARPRWRGRLEGQGLLQADQPSAADYLETLAAMGLVADVWETTYHHVLAGEDAVLQWMRGSGLRPVLTSFGSEEAETFVGEYAALLRGAHRRRPWGTVLPFHRTFAVAHRPHVEGDP